MRFQPLLAIKNSVMHPLYLLAVLSLLLVSPAMTFPEPYNPSCGTALEKVHKARKALVPYQRTMELAKARERKAYGELTICTGGGIFSVDKAVRCNEAKWQAPEMTRKAIDTEDQYLQGRKAFEELFEQARRECLLEP
jgi:hypothetical protein